VLGSLGGGGGVGGGGGGGGGVNAMGTRAVAMAKAPIS
jgi:hypothetical protein